MASSGPERPLGNKPVMRVLMVNYEFPPFGGGTGMACANLLRELGARGDVVVDLVTSGPAAAVERVDFAPGITVHRLPTPKRDLHFWRMSELAVWTGRALRYADRLRGAGSYDLCHCWASWPSGLIGWRMRRRLPYVVALRGSDVPGYSTRLRRLDPLVMRHLVRRVWRGAARVVAVSKDLRTLALGTEPEACIDVIPNGVDVRRFTPGVAGHGELLFVGRLIERKGVHLLVEAMRTLAPEHPALTLTIVGDGPERSRLEAMVSEAGLDGRVRFRGFLAGADLIAAYRDAAIMVLPASSDAMPNVVLEGMAAGLAIVTTRNGARELLHDNGVVVDRPTAVALHACIDGYLRDPALLVRHQQSSRRLAEHMSWSAVAEYFVTVYADVLSEPHGVVDEPARVFRGPVT